MELLHDLAGVPRKELLELIARQRAGLRQQQLAELQRQVVALQQRLSELEGGGGAGAAKGMPGLKPQSAKAVRSEGPRQLCSQQFVRCRSAPLSGWRIWWRCALTVGRG